MQKKGRDMTSAKGLLVLLGCRDERGIFRVPVDADWKVGVFIEPKGQDPASLQKELALRIGRPDLAGRVEIEHVFEDAIAREGHEALSLCIAVLPEGSFEAPTSWPTLPDLLRSMGPGRERVVVMKAVQLLAGSHKDTLSAIELTEDVRKALLRSLDPDFQG